MKIKTQDPLRDEYPQAVSASLHLIVLGSGEKPGVTSIKAGEHAFRRYRDGYLRTQNCPAGLLKYWLGHSGVQDMSDLYDGSVADDAYRLEMSEKLGIGFQVPLVVPSVPNCTEETKTATMESVAVCSRS